MTGNLPSWLPELLAAVLAVVLAITLHEAAHGYAARALGDDTAARLGRISLNPLRHVDPVGTLLVPGLLVVSQLVTIGRVEAMFGWARPVPVDPWRLRSPRRDMALVAAAGPAANFALAWVAALALHPVLAPDSPVGVEAAEWLARFLALSILGNLVLGLFNLLPIPPLDGGRILVSLLPRGPALALAGLERWGVLLVLVLVLVVPRLGLGIDPVGWALETVVRRALALVLALAGDPVPE